MKKTKKLTALLLTLTFALSTVSMAFAADGSTKLGSETEESEISVAFNSDFSISQEDINVGGDIPIMGDIYHVASDCIATLSYSGKSPQWSVKYYAYDGGFNCEAKVTAGQVVKVKYFDSVDAAKSFWDASPKDTLAIVDKTGARIDALYLDADGYETGATLYLNFDGAGAAPKNNTTSGSSKTEAAAVSSATLKTTDGLYGTLPPLVTPGQDLSYTVMPKENLAGIAYNYYGSMSEKTINKIVKANSAYFKGTKGVLEAYAVLTLPKEGLINPVSPDSLNNAAGAYLVERGDTLADIAKVYYGDKGAWRKIYEANKGRVKLVGKSPMIYEKQWLIIPN